MNQTVEIDGNNTAENCITIKHGNLKNTIEKHMETVVTNDTVKLANSNDAKLLVSFNCNDFEIINDSSIKIDKEFVISDHDDEDEIHVTLPTTKFKEENISIVVNEVYKDIPCKDWIIFNDSYYADYEVVYDYTKTEQFMLSTTPNNTIQVNNLDDYENNVYKIFNRVVEKNSITDCPIDKKFSVSHTEEA